MVASITAFAAGASNLPVRYIQHQHVVDLWWLYLSWGDCQKASWSTFWRCWTSTWFHCLRLRKPCQHSQCDVCWEASQYLHHGMGSWREKQVRAQQWQLHLRQQYADRCVYWTLRWASKQPRSDILCLIVDGLDKSKLVFPQYHFRCPKQLDKFFRPRCEIHLALVHGYAANFFVSEEESIFHGGSYVLEILVRSLAQVKAERQRQGLSMPRHLCLQSDNTVSQLKNAESSLFLGVLLRRFGFDTCGLTYLQKGHTHEDVDFVFSLLLGRVLRKVKIQCPQDLCEEIKAGMEDLLLAKGYKTHAELVTHCRNFKSWLDNLGVTPHGCYLPRQGRDCPHSFCFKFRMDLSQLEKEAVERIEPPRHRRQQHDLDVFCITKKIMSSTESFTPVLLIPNTIIARLPAVPTQTIDVEMADKRKADLYGFAAELERLSSQWGIEHSLFRAAAEIRILANGRPKVQSQDGFLESLAAAVERNTPLPLNNAPYYNHLPNITWQMMVRFRR